ISTTNSGRLTTDELERPRLGGIALEQPRALQVCEVRMDRRGRRKPDGLADLPNRRRIAVPVDVLDEEVPDLLLSSGQHFRLQRLRDGQCSGLPLKSERCATCAQLRSMRRSLRGPPTRTRVRLFAAASS